MEPIVNRFAKENPDITIVRVNIEDQVEMAKEFRVMSIPTFIACKDGTPIGRHTGMTSQSNLKKLLD